MKKLLILAIGICLISACHNHAGNNSSTASQVKTDMIQRKNLLQEQLNEQFVNAIKEDNLIKVKKLLAAGANINTRDNFERTPLMYAIDCDIELVQFLINSGADVNAKDDIGYTALMHNITQKYINIEIVKLLLNAGANVNVKAKWNHTPLLLANDNPELVKLLKYYGAKE